MIPITAIRYDASEAKDNEYLFTIFHRLNSGGVKLNNQEIRNCIYSGPLNKLLKELSAMTETKKLFGRNYRFSSDEMILRFFSFNENLDYYGGKLSKFLNDYMHYNRNINEDDVKRKKSLYITTVKKICEQNCEVVKLKLSKTVMEGLMFGVSKNIDAIKSLDNNNFQTLYNKFSSLPEYSPDKLKEGLSNKDRVLERLESSRKCFDLDEK